MRRKQKKQTKVPTPAEAKAAITDGAAGTTEDEAADIYMSGVITIENIPTGKQILKNRSGKRAFFIAFCTTMTVLWLIIGMITVDRHGRRMSLNDNTPVVEVIEQEDGIAVMTIHAFTFDRSLDVTALMEFWHQFKEFFCIPD